MSIRSSAATLAQCPLSIVCTQLPTLARPMSAGRQALVVLLSVHCMTASRPLRSRLTLSALTAAMEQSLRRSLLQMQTSPLQLQRLLFLPTSSMSASILRGLETGQVAAVAVVRSQFVLRLPRRILQQRPATEVLSMLVPTRWWSSSPIQT